MATVATLTVDLIGDSAKLRSELARANKSTKNWAAQTRQQVNSAAKFMVGAGVAGTAALTAIYADAAKTGDAMAKLSDQIGVLPEDLAGLQHAAEITTTGGTEMLNKSLVKMSKSLGEAQSGVGEAGRYLKQLGLDTEEFFGLNPAAQFSEIAQQINGLGSQSEKAAASSAIFGRSGGELINTFALGKDGIAAMAQEARDLGLTLSRVDLAQIEAANDEFHRAKSTTGAFGRVLAVEVAPLVKAISADFVNAAKEAGGFGKVASNVVDSVITGAAYLADVIHGLSVVWDGVKAATYSYLQAATATIAGVDRIISGLIDKIPGVSATASKTLQAMASDAKSSAEKARANFQDSLLAPMPSEKVKRWVDDARSAAVDAATAASAKPVSIMPDVSGVSAVDDTALESIRKQLRTEEEALEESYTARQQMIDQAHLAGQLSDKAYNDLLLKNSTQYFEAEQKLQEQRNTMAADVESVRQQLLTEEEALQESYDKRQAILDEAHLAEQISDQEYRELMLKNSAQYFEREQQMQAAKNAGMLNNYASLFDSMAGLAEAAGGKQSKAYKAMFAASKAFSIAESIVKIQGMLTSGAALPYPANLAAMASVASATSGIVTTIQGTKMQSFDGGGYTGNAPRTGGLDGKGGFMAMMHPKETVIDHTKGQSTPQNNSSGSGANVNILFDPEAMRAVTQSQGFTNDFLEIVELNQDEIRSKLGF